MTDDRPDDFAIGGSKRPGDTIYIQPEPTDTIIINDPDGNTDEIITNDEPESNDELATDITEAGDNYHNSIYWTCLKILRKAADERGDKAISFSELLALIKHAKKHKLHI
jgi:hypothetical protein